MGFVPLFVYVICSEERVDDFLMLRESVIIPLQTLAIET